MLKKNEFFNKKIKFINYNLAFFCYIKSFLSINIIIIFIFICYTIYIIF